MYIGTFVVESFTIASAEKLHVSSDGDIIKGLFISVKGNC